MRRGPGTRGRSPGAGDDRLEAGVEQELESRAVDRLIFFSDAVVAIAITLLAIDLPVPAGHSLSLFWSSVRDNQDRYLAFLVSFFAIAAAWSDHHDAFRYTRRMDQRLRSLNMAWLLMIVIMPFATKLLTVGSHEGSGVHAVRFGFYALAEALLSVIMIIILRHMVSRDLAPGVPSSRLTGMAWRSYSLALGFGLSIPVFFATTYAWVIWIVVPTLVRGVHHRRRRVHPDRPAA
jgi:uncharacterized membrane protein